MIHTPEQSRAALARLNAECKIKFKDVSYGNDMCDSVGNAQYDLQIMLPR